MEKTEIEKKVQELKVLHPSFSMLVLRYMALTLSKMKNAPENPKREKRRKYTPKEKAKYAVEMNAPENPKWMQKWIDFQDPQVPIGKRRVAYVRYLTITKGVSLEVAKERSLRIIK